MDNTKLRKAVRKKFNTDAEFSLAIGWVPQKAHKMLSGIYIPKLSEAKKISNALGITIDELASFFTQ